MALVMFACMKSDTPELDVSYVGVLWVNKALLLFPSVPAMLLAIPCDNGKTLVKGSLLTITLCLVHPAILSSLCKLSYDQAPVDEISGHLIIKWVAITWLDYGARIEIPVMATKSTCPTDLYYV